MSTVATTPEPKTLSGRLIRVLGRATSPVATPELVARCGYDRPNARSQVWVILRSLERAGLVRRQRATTPRRDARGHNVKLTLWSPT